MVNIVKPGDTFPEEKRIEYMSKWESTVSEKQAVAERSDKSPLRFVEEMVPDNIVKSMGDNSKDASNHILCHSFCSIDGTCADAEG